MDRKAMYKLSYGLFILTAKEAEKDNGCIINTAIQAASEPNQLSICVNKANYTHDMIQRTGKFTVSVLSQKAQFELFKHFGLRRWTKGYRIKQPNMDCQPTEITALMRHRAVFS